MLNALFRSYVRRQALTKGKMRGLYARLCRPSPEEYAEFVRRYGGFHAFGKDCTFLTSTNVTDPAYVSIGDNVHFSTCTLLGHDGSVSMLNRAYGVKLDAVGKIVIKDNVFIGYNAVIMPNVVVGPRAIVAAGSLVTKDVQEGDIVGGVPARPIGRVDDLVEKWKTATASYPWVDLIEKREGSFDPSLEPELVRRRVAYFFPPEK